MAILVEVKMLQIQYIVSLNADYQGPSFFRVFSFLICPWVEDCRNARGAFTFISKRSEEFLLFLSPICTN